MIKCNNCGVMYEDYIAICPVCSAVDEARLSQLIATQEQNDMAKDNTKRETKSVNVKEAKAKIELQNNMEALNPLTVRRASELSGEERAAAVQGLSNIYKAKAPRKPLALSPIQIYTITALLVLIAAALLNFYLTPKIFWCPIVLLAVIYGAFTILNTVSSNTGYSVKLLYQITFLCVAMYLCTMLFKYKDWYAEYAFPIVMILGMTAQFGFMMTTHNRYRSHYVSTVFIALLGYLPLIIAYTSGLSMVTSYVSAGLATFIIGMALLAGGKKLFTEVSGRFDY